MYEALDAFLNVETWDSLHWADEERFYRALDSIVRNRDFSASAMGEYIERKYIERYGEVRDRSHLENNRDHYVRAAELVRRYLRATNK